MRLVVAPGGRVEAVYGELIDLAELGRPRITRASRVEPVISACRDHVGHNAHTSKRIKHKKMNRFVKFGGATPCEIFGYAKPPGAKTFDDWAGDEAAGPVYRDWLRTLSETLNCTAVADMLNASGIPVGPHCRRTTWDGAMVRRITANPLLKGRPGRGFRHTVKHHETGRRIAVTNPDGPVFRDCPHLAFWSADDFDEINARLDAADAGVGRRRVGGVDPRRLVPRKRTRFPGQHARCWYRGDLAVWGGHGRTANLMCNRARRWNCWDSMGFDGARAAAWVADAVADALAGLDAFDGQTRTLAEDARREGGAGLAQGRAELARDEEALGRQEKNTRDAIAECGPLPMFKEKLAELDRRRRDLAGRRRDLGRRAGREPQLPASAAELRALFAAKFRDLARGSYEFGDLLRLVVPRFHVYLVRLLDGGHPLPRARAVLSLAGVVADAGRAPGYVETLTRVVTVDLFEPPQREQIRADAVRLAGEGIDQRETARALGVTQPAVANALALDRLMRQRGLDSPYALLTGPPDDYPKLRRHRNAKYLFEPLADYQRPAP